MEGSAPKERDGKFWTMLVIAYVILLGLTMLKDYAFTHNVPNPLFYFSVPPVSMLGSAALLHLFSKITRREIAFLGFLKVLFLTEFIFQIWENLAKIVYYVVWQYPGMLWFVVYPLSIAVVAWLLHRRERLSWWAGLGYALLGNVLSLAIGLLFTSLTGIETPGS